MYIIYSRLRFSIVLICSFFCALNLCAMGDSSITVPLTMEYHKNIPIKPIIKVSIGGGEQASLVFDTGSAGIFIKKSLVGKHIDTNKVITRDYGSGTREHKYNGKIAISTVQIIDKDASGKEAIVAETYPIPIIVVPDEVYGDSKHDGIFGVRLSNEKYGIISPLAALTNKSLSSGFIVDVNDYSQSTVILGLNKDNVSGFKLTDPLPKQHSHRSISKSVPKDINFWDTSKLPTKSVIYLGSGNQNQEKMKINTHKTIFDTGSNRIHYCLDDHTRKELKNLMYDRELLKQEALLEIELPEVFDWKIQPSLERHNSHNVYFLDEKKHRSYLNTGIGIFFQYKILYDIKNGKIGFLKKK